MRQVVGDIQQVASHSDVTRIHPDESQGHAGAAHLSQSETGAMFAAGVGAAAPTVSEDIRPGQWGDGTVKPCCSRCAGTASNGSDSSSLI